MWFCAAGFVLATAMGLREVWAATNPSSKLILAPVSAACMTLFAAIEAWRDKDDERLKYVAIVLVFAGALFGAGRLFV